ncbi:MAG: 50S ribosomal protein L3 [Patescibacteria group bacterium]
MISGFIAKKKAMTSVYSPEGKRIGVTALLAKPVKVSSLKTVTKNGYQAVEVAFGVKGHKEFSPISETFPEINTEISVDLVFSPGDIVTATAKTKGRGFAGVIKRWGFHRQPVSGGQSDRVRAPGSIGAQTPGKVIKGKKMPGHYGNATKTITGLKIVSLNKETHLIYVSGSVPGAFNSWVTLKKVHEN